MRYGLEKVIEAVEATPDDEFRMDRWLCGSVGCAIGQFCRRNPDADLKLEMLEMRDRRFLLPVLNGVTGFAAVAKYFAIPEEDAEELFDPTAYFDPSKQNVLDRLREYVAPHQ